MILSFMNVVCIGKTHLTMYWNSKMNTMKNSSRIILHCPQPAGEGTLLNKILLSNKFHYVLIEY